MAEVLYIPGTGSRCWDRVCASACHLPMRGSVRESVVKTLPNGQKTNTNSS